MNIEYIKIDELVPYELNAKQHDQSQIDSVAKSLEKYKWRGNPVLIDDSNIIIAGHCRVLAAKQLGWTEVPCERCTDMTDEQVREYRLLDNKLNESPWDFELLAADMSGLEFDGFDIDWGLPEEEDTVEVSDDDFDVTEALKESEAAPFTQPGDLWIIGKHRLICGDSTDANVVAQLMDGKTADMCLTDPPYNVDYVGKQGQGKIDNDNMSSSEFKSFLDKAFSNIYNSLIDGGSIYVFHADTEGVNFRTAFTDAGFYLSEVCVWVKQSLVLGRQDYHWRHEPILYGWKLGAAHRWLSDRSQSTVWEFDRPTRSDEHPTMKPIPLCAYPIQNSCPKGGIVIDVFGSSGSTLIACEQTERTCYCVELSPAFCDTIVKRYVRSFGGEEITLIRDGSVIKPNFGNDSGTT